MHGPDPRAVDTHRRRIGVDPILTVDIARNDRTEPSRRPCPDTRSIDMTAVDRRSNVSATDGAKNSSTDISTVTQVVLDSRPWLVEASTATSNSLTASSFRLSRHPTTRVPARQATAQAMISMFASNILCGHDRRPGPASRSQVAATEDSRRWWLTEHAGHRATRRCPPSLVLGAEPLSQGTDVSPNGRRS